MVEFFECEPEIGEDEVREVETLVGYSLPVRYREHLLVHNGGRCEPNGFSFNENGNISRSQVDWFLAIHQGEYDNLKTYIDILKLSQKRMPKHILPIAHDPGGNFICISCGGLDCGSIYFWDHEKEVDYHLSDDFDYSNLYLISADFDTFMEGLFDTAD